MESELERVDSIEYYLMFFSGCKRMHVAISINGKEPSNHICNKNSVSFEKRKVSFDDMYRQVTCKNCRNLVWKLLSDRLIFFDGGMYLWR